jgi:hypothetical protein
MLYILLPGTNVWYDSQLMMFCISFMQNRSVSDLYTPKLKSGKQIERNLLRNFRYETCGQADTVSPVGA